MKNLKLYIGVFLAAYLTFIAVNMPASVVVSNLTLPKGVNIGAVSGSVWQGRISALQHNRELISDIHWQLSPMALLVGGLSADVRFGSRKDTHTVSGSGGISTDFGFSQIDLSDFTLRYPAKDLAQKLNLGIPATLGGRVVLNIDEYGQGKPYCESLLGTMSWVGAQIDVTGDPIELGKLDAELGCEKGELELKVTKKNPLGLQIKTLIGANNKFSVKGFVKPNGDMPDSVHNAMSYLGKADSKGRFPINF